MPGLESKIIFEETMIIVCTPNLIHDKTMLEAEQMDRYKLLHYNEQNYIHDWKALFKSIGLPAPEPRSSQSFNSYIVYLQAILNGDGLGIGWSGLLGDLLADGRLSKASEISLKTSSGYYCCLQEQAVGNDDARVFMDWVCGVG